MPGFLEDLDPDARSALLALARPLLRQPGDELIRFGQPARGAFVLASGTAEVLRALPGGGTLTVATLPPGSIFGEASLIEQGLSTASVVARTPVEAWFIERESFRALVAQAGRPARRVQLALSRVLIGRLRALNRKVLESAVAGDPPEAFDGRQGERIERCEADFAAADFAGKFPFFNGYDEDEIAEILALGTLLGGRRRALVFAAGEPGERFFLTLRGALELGATGDGRFRRLAVVGPGQPLGHCCLLEGDRHTLTARVREPALVLAIGAERFRDLCCGDSPLAAKVQRSLQRALVNAIQRTNTQLTRRVSEDHLRATG